jgi:Uma2 family endonuclease
MASTVEAAEAEENLAELVERLGGIPLERIRLRPPPGTAKERDVIAALEAPRKRICELVDGVLVEKPLGAREGLLAAVLIQLLWNHVEAHDLGVVIGADGPFRLWLGLVRIPDVSFVSWERLPGGEFPPHAIARVIPDLAVEVLSKGNTKKEIERKLREYFQACVRLAWVVEPKTETARAYTAPDQVLPISREGALDGGDVLPGFNLPLKQLFARTRRRPRD